MNIIPAPVSEARVLCNKDEVAALVSPDSLISRMAARNPAAFHAAWSEAGDNKMYLHVPVDEAYRMADFPRKSPVDEELFRITQSHLLRLKS